MGFLRCRWRGGDFYLRSRGRCRRRGSSRNYRLRGGGFRRTRPARDILLRDFAHCLRDGEVRDSVRLVDPSRAVQPLHFLAVKPRQVRSRIRLQLGVRISWQGQMQSPVGRRTRIEPQRDQRQNDRRSRHRCRADPDETCADIGWLVSRGGQVFLSHGAAPARAPTASEAHGAPAQPQFRSRRASPPRRRCRNPFRMRAPPATSCGRSRLV